MNQAQLSKRIGIASNYYNMIEKGDRQIDMSLSIITKLAKAFEIPVEEIIQMETEYKAAITAANKTKGV